MAQASTFCGGSWPVVGVVMAAGIVTAIHAGKVAIATPMLQQVLGIDLAAVGWLTGIFAVLGFAGGLPAGALTGLAGDRRSLVAGLTVTAIGAGIGATTSEYQLLLASRSLEGAGFLLITVAGPALLGRAVPPAQHDAAFALWSCFMPVGLALALLVGPLFEDWRMLWWAGAGGAALTGLAVRAIVPAAPQRIPTSWTRLVSDAREVVVRRAVLLSAGCFALYSLMFFALFSFLPVLLATRMALSHGTAGWFSALAICANIIGNLSAGYVLARGTGRAALISGACLIMGLSSFGIFLGAFGNATVFLLCVLFAAAGGLIPAALISAAPSLAGSAARTPLTLGLLMQGSNLGQMIGPAAVGSSIAAYGWPAAAALVAGAAVIAALAARRIAFDDHTDTRQPRRRDGEKIG
jgi:predicted MFS family arabinose efflux permease